MNCEDMVEIPELENVLLLRAGAGGMKNIVRWIYFADFRWTDTVCRWKWPAAVWTAGEISADRPLPDTLQQTCAGGKQ